MRAVIVSHAAIKAANRAPYRALAQRGVAVTLVVPARWQSGLGPLCAEPEPAGTGIELIVRRRRGLSHSNVYWLAGGLGALLRGAPRTVIYVDEDPAGFAAAQAAAAAERYRHALVVLGVQNILKRYPPPFAQLQRYVFARAAAAVSMTEQAAQTLRARGYRGPNAIMPFTTDLAPLPTGVRAQVRAGHGVGGPLVGYVGRLVPEKGVDVFIEAVARVEGISALIVGDGVERERLRAQARRLGVEERVRFTGALESIEAARAIGALDVLSLPSRTTPQWSEQFGRVLIEAMASDVPVVASSSGAIPEVVGDAAVLVGEGRPEELARGISSALQPSRARELARRGRERVMQHYSLSAQVDALHGALHTALDRREKRR